MVYDGQDKTTLYLLGDDMGSTPALLDAADGYLRADDQNKTKYLDDILQASHDLRESRNPRVSRETLSTVGQAGAEHAMSTPLDQAAASAQLLATVALHRQTGGHGHGGDDQALKHTIHATKALLSSSATPPDADQGLAGSITHKFETFGHEVGRAAHWLMDELHLDDLEKKADPDPDKLKGSLEVLLDAIPTAGVEIVNGSVPLLTADLGAIFKGPLAAIEAALAPATANAGHVERLLREAALHLLSAFGSPSDATNNKIIADVVNAIDNVKKTLMPKIEAGIFGDLIGTRRAIQQVDAALTSTPTAATAAACASKVNKEAAIYFVGAAALVKLLKVLAAIGAALILAPGVNLAPEATLAGLGLLAVAAAILGGLAENSSHEFASITGIPGLVSGG